MPITRRRDMYPLAPLLAAVGNPTHAVVADAMGVEKVTVHKWVLRGIDAWKADRLAVAFGRHPWQVWPSWFDDSIAWDEDLAWKRRTVECACDGCTVRFAKPTGRRAHRRFCSDACKHRHNRRLWRERNRETHREQRRRYYYEVERREAA